MFIPERIKVIGDFIEENESVADIGADHGLLELYLLAKNPDISVIAIENKNGPYNILSNTLKSFRNVRLSLSDGLESVDRNVTTYVIAGMGGINIAKIINAYPNKVAHAEKIIIDAHRDIKIARQAILKFNYEFVEEKIVFEEDKYYIISCFKNNIRKRVSYDKDTIEIGYNLYNDPLWNDYKNYLMKLNNNTIEKVRDNPKLKSIVTKLRNKNRRLENYGKNQTI